MPLWTNVDEAAGKPKYLSDTPRNDQTDSDLASVVGISTVEAQTEANQLVGLNSSGWVLKQPEYTDSNGNVRNKSEVLVAMGSMSGDADTIPPTATLTVTVANISIPIGETSGAFSAVVTSNYPATYTYAWEYDDGVNGYQTIDGETSATLALSDADTDLWVDGYTFRVTVGADLNVSSATDTATLTIL